MKFILSITIIFCLILSSCTSAIDKSDPLTSGRGFIEASLKGDYKTAQNYLLDDSTNIQYFDLLKDFANKMTPENRRGYAEANIIIDSS
ncbi:MAG: hypothetical protein ABI091_17665, partial [Ferruginibacter sp.]